MHFGGQEILFNQDGGIGSEPPSALGPASAPGPSGGIGPHPPPPKSAPGPGSASCPSRRMNNCPMPQFPSQPTPTTAPGPPLALDLMYEPYVIFSIDPSDRNGLLDA